MYNRRLQVTPNKPSSLNLPRLNVRFPDLDPSPTLVSCLHLIEKLKKTF